MREDLKDALYYYFEGDGDTDDRMAEIAKKWGKAIHTDIGVMTGHFERADASLAEELARERDEVKPTHKEIVDTLKIARKALEYAGEDAANECARASVKALIPRMECDAELKPQQEELLERMQRLVAEMERAWQSAK